VATNNGSRKAWNAVRCTLKPQHLERRRFANKNSDFRNQLVIFVTRRKWCAHFIVQTIRLCCIKSSSIP